LAESRPARSASFFTTRATSIGGIHSHGLSNPWAFPALQSNMSFEDRPVVFETFLPCPLVCYPKCLYYPEPASTHLFATQSGKTFRNRTPAGLRPSPTSVYKYAVTALTQQQQVSWLKESRQTLFQLSSEAPDPSRLSLCFDLPPLHRCTALIQA
jgi:hypothetical protein